MNDRQLSLLELLRKTIDEPLSIRELQDRLSMTSPGQVHHYIKQLEKNGYLRRNQANPSDYQVLDGPNKKVAYLNFYGNAQCGPRGSIIDMAPIDKIPISSALLGFDANEAFILKAKGDSMLPRIKEGDLIIVKKSSTADKGSLIVCVNDGEVLLKKYFPSKDGVILHSLNESEYPPFLASKDDFRIEGIVRGIYSYDS